MPNYFIHKKVLIAPLDWGLGHATRCISLIKFLQQVGCEVYIASYDNQLTLLKKEFPHLQTISLKGYNVSYTKYKRWLPFKILFQSPKILLSICKEHQWLEQKIKDYEINLVISDNRYGLWTTKIPCIIIIHQLFIKAGPAWLEKLIQKLNYKYINHFNECWVPDFEEKPNMGGELSHPLKMPQTPVKYIGLLSRFDLKTHTQKKYDYTIILSGPEPQRTVLEEKLLKIVPLLKGEVIIVRGKPVEKDTIEVPANCKVFNHLNTVELQQVINESEFIISRSGYTTIMEILSLQKKSILIPTPGQTEQEYLAKHLMNQQWCYSCSQEDDLLYHINNAKEFWYNLPSFSTLLFPHVVQDFFKSHL